MCAKLLPATSKQVGKSQNGKHECSSTHLDVRLTAWRYADVWEPILALLFVVIAVVVVLQSSPIICINCLHICILDERLDRYKRLAAAPLHFLHIHSKHTALQDPRSLIPGLSALKGAAHGSRLPKPVHFAIGINVQCFFFFCEPEGSPLCVIPPVFSLFFSLSLRGVVLPQICPIKENNIYSTS